MAEVIVGESVDSEVPLWRYMSLDKLINLLDTNSLFFTPLESYEQTDPFEGYIPKAAFEAYGEIFSPQVRELKQEYEKFEVRAQNNPSLLPHLRKMEEGIIALDLKVKNTFKLISKGTTVNCWHANESESEAMWKLYSDNQKGVAVKTSVASLVSAIEDDEQEVKVNLGAVKYLDFLDSSLTPADCRVDGYLTPLLKRNSYKHEHEVRLFISPRLNPENISEFTPKASVIGANAKMLIEAVYISPFAGEPYTSSVEAICRLYGVDSRIVHTSRLLTGHESLLDSIVTW